MSGRTQALLGGVFLVVFLAAYVLRVQGDLHDFEVDYMAGQRLRAGEDLYRVEDGHYMYKYPPGAAVMEMPLSLMPLGLAKFLFYSLLVGCLFVALRLSYELLPATAPKTPLLQILTFLVLGKYLIREIDLGQVNLIITVLLLFMMRQLISGETEGSVKRIHFAGLLWGAATVLKPYGLIFVPYLIVTGRWRVIAAGLAVLAAALAAPVFFYGVEGTVVQHVQWVRTLADSSPELLQNEDHTSIVGFFVRWLGNTRAAWTWIAISAVLLGGLVLDTVRRGGGRTGALVLEGGLLLTLIPLLSPQGWNYLYLMSVLAVMLLLQHRGRFHGLWRWGLIVNLLVIAVTISNVIGHALHGLYEAWTATTLNFLVVVGYIAVLRRRGDC